jgi:ATP-dependent protease HslVU (ClpYQ) peptidase subunit
MTIGLLGTLYGFGIFEQLGVDVDGMIASFFGGAGRNTGGKGGTQPVAVLSEKEKQALQSAEGKQASMEVRDLFSSFDRVIASDKEMNSEQLRKRISELSHEEFQDTREGAALMGIAANGLSLLYKYTREGNLRDDNLKANIVQLYREAFINKDQRALQAAIGLMYDFVMGVYSSGPQVLEGERVPPPGWLGKTEPVETAVQNVFERKAAEVLEKVRDLNELKKHYAERNLSVDEIRRGLGTVINGNIQNDNEYNSLHRALLGLMAVLGNVNSYNLDNWDNTWYGQIKNKSYLRGLLTPEQMNRLLEIIRPGTFFVGSAAMAARGAASKVLEHRDLLSLLHLAAAEQTSQQEQQSASPSGQQGQGQPVTGQPVQITQTQQTP